MKTLKFLLADDHALLRKGLADLLAEEFADAEIAQVTNGNDVLTLARKEQWDVILMDINMPGRNGIDTLKQLIAEGIKTPILIITMYPEEQYAVRVLRAGAFGFLNKESATEELLVAIYKVLNGRKYISPSIAELLAESMGDSSDKPLHELLSDRELEIVQHIAKGKTVSEIADELSLSVHTISTYRARALEKLAVSNNVELARYAADNGLV